MDLTFFIGVIAGSIVLWGWLVPHWLPRLLAFFAIAGIAFVGGAGFVTQRQEQLAANHQRVTGATNPQAHPTVAELLQAFGPAPGEPGYREPTFGR